MTERHSRKVIRRHIVSGNYIDTITISKAVSVLEPYFPPHLVLQSERSSLIRKYLKEGEVLYSHIYQYELK